MLSLVCGVVRCRLLRLYYESGGDDEGPGGWYVVPLGLSCLCSGRRRSAQPNAGETGSGQSQKYHFGK